MQTEMSNLASLLDKACTVIDASNTKSVIRKVHLLLVKGCDLTPLTGRIVKFLSSQDILARKVACLFVSRLKHPQDVGLLAINSLLKDTRDPNPLYRGLALNTLFDVPSTMEQGVPRLVPALEDNSAYVRRAAVSCCGKLSRFYPTIVDELDLTDKLYAMIRDQDPIVVVQCLHILDEVLESEGGITVNKKIAWYLLKQLPAFHSWGVIGVLECLKKYQPKTNEEALMIVNALDAYLTSNNVAVQLSAFALFRHTIRGRLDHLLREAIGQVWSKLSIHLSFSAQEMVWNILDWGEEFLLDYPEVFRPRYRLFYCRFSDSPALKRKKMAGLRSLVDRENVSEAADEILGYCTDLDRDVCRCALRTLVSLANQHKVACEVVRCRVLPLLDVSDEVLVTEVLCALCALRFDQKSVSFQERILETVMQRKWSLTSVDAKCGVIEFISEHGQDFAPSVYILEDYAASIEGEDESVKQSLLGATVKMFFSRPSELQDLLGTVLTALCKDSNPFVRAQANWYYVALLNDVATSKQIVLGS
ncbi:unnamed protein product [Ixodes persulcatus]